MALRKLLDSAEEILAGIGLVLVIGITAYGIFNRYVLEQSAAWAPEMAGILYAWVVFLGASAAWKRNMHISIDVAVRQLGPRARRSVQVAGDLLLLLFLAYVTVLAIEITISAHTRISPVMGVPFSYVYASASIAFALMLARRAVSLWHQLAAPVRARRP